MFEDIVRRARAGYDDEVENYTSSPIMFGVHHVPTLCHGYCVAKIPAGAHSVIVNTLEANTGLGTNYVPGYIIGEEDCEMPLVMLGMYVIHKNIDPEFKTEHVRDSAWSDIVVGARRWKPEATARILDVAKFLNVNIPNVSDSLVH